MCGRFANRIAKASDGISFDGTEWAELMKIWPEVNPSYNISPGETIAAFRGPAGKAMRWGLIPHWAKECKSEFSTFNARLETLADKPVI